MQFWQIILYVNAFSINMFDYMNSSGVQLILSMFGKENGIFYSVV
jgi:hypothetical protein